MKVIAINEECHGQIGVASDYRHAVSWLINNNWLGDNVEMCVNGQYQSIKEILGEDWIEQVIENWDISYFNNFFIDCYWLEEIKVYDGTDDKQENEEEHYYIISGTWSAGIFAYSEEDAKKWFKETWTRQNVEIDLEDFTIKEFD